MKRDYHCTICKTQTLRISPVAHLGAEGFSWEHESTMRLLGLECVECALRFCPNCHHSIIFPLFDASKLYGEEGSLVRREVYERFHPGEGYVSNSECALDTLFLRSSQDMSRFADVAGLIGDRVKASFEDIQEFRILDWGGGDGYVSTVFASVLQAVSGLPTSSIVFDYTEWKEVGDRKATLEELEEMPKFHMVLLFGVLEHTHEPEETIRKATQYLHEDGVVVCEVPDERYGVINAIVRRQRFGLHYHVCGFCQRSLHALMERSGLDNVHVEFQGNSSYRGKATRSFVGVGQKADFPSRAGTIPGKLSSMGGFVKYFMWMAAGKMRRLLCGLFPLNRFNMKKAK